MNILHKIRLHTKLMVKNTGLIKFIPLMGFCKECGVSVRDFSVPSYIWSEISNNITHGDILCFHCFTDVCKANNYESIFILSPNNDIRRIREIANNLEVMVMAGNKYSAQHTTELLTGMYNDLNDIVYGKTWIKNYWQKRG